MSDPGNTTDPALTRATHEAAAAATQTEYRKRDLRRPANRAGRRAAAKADRANGVRVGDLLVARESDLSDQVLMTAMVGQTLAFASDLPGVATIRELELLPLTDPDKCSASTGLQIRVLREPGARAVLFMHEGVLYLYSMGSAAKADEDGDNAFIKILVDVLSEFRPQRLRVATFSRLVRAPEFAGQLYAAVLNNVEIVLVGIVPIDLRTQQGKALWQVFGMVAAMERDLIVARLIAGMVAKYRRGEWVDGKLTVPPGYRLNPKTSKVELTKDPAEILAVRELLLMLADTTLSKRQLIARAGALGLSTPKLKQLYGEDATYADCRNPGEAVETLLRWLDTYRTGKAVVTQVNAFQGQTHIAGHYLDFEDEDDQFGYLTFEYDWGLPDGGWVDDDVIEAAKARKVTRDATGGRAHARLGALTGVDWVEEGARLFLTGEGGVFYHLMSHPYEAPPLPAHLPRRDQTSDDDDAVTLTDRAVRALLAARRLGQ